MDTISNFLCVEKMGWSDAYSHFGYSEDKSLESIKKIHENSQVYHFSGGN